MNDYRSPFGGKKLTLIGILLTVLVSVIFIPTIYNKKYSDVKAAKAETNIEEAKTKPNFVPAEKEIIEVEEKEEITLEFHYPIDVVHKIEEVQRQKAKDYVPATVQEIMAKVEAEKKDREEDETTAPAATGSYCGTFELTAYTWTGNPCADGVYPSSGYTVACNNSELWHHWIYIEGYGNYYVHDTGGMGYGVIDIYMDSYDACIQFGRRSANIYIID